MKNSIQLRDYQQMAVDSNRHHLFDLGYAATIDFLATGLGKTRVAAATVEQLFDLNQHRVLFIVSFRELVLQGRAAFIELMPEIQGNNYTAYSRPGVGVVMGNYNQPSARLIFGTPQTLTTVDGASDRMEEVLKYGAIDLVIFDEAHFAVTSSLLGLRKRLTETNPKVKFLGLTATPVRYDGKALSDMFDSIAISRNIQWGTDNGYLCKIRDPDIIETNITLPNRGSIEEKGKALDVRNWCEIVLEGYFAKGEERKGIMFMPSVQHSIQFAEYASQRGILTAHIDGEKTIDPEGHILSVSARHKMFERYKPDGDIRLLSNYNVLTTGIDLPHTALIGWARPTDNEVLLTQCVGRGTRLFPGKEDLVILDYVVKDVGLVMSGDLLGFDDGQTKKKTEDEEESEPTTPIPPMPKLEPEEVGVGLIFRVGNLFKKSKSAWYSDGEISTLGCSRTNIIAIVAPNYTLSNRIQLGLNAGEQYLLDHPDDEKANSFFSLLRNSYTLFSNFTVWKLSGTINKDSSKETVSWAVQNRWLAHADSVELAFDFAAPLIADVADSSFENKNRPWRKNDPITPDQVKFLQRIGMSDIPSGKGSKGLASQMITHYIAINKIKPVLEFYQRSCKKYGDLTKDLG